MKKIVLFILILINTPTLFGQNNNLEKVDAYLINYQQKIPIPGFSIVIVENGKVLFSKGYGVEKQGLKTKMTPNSSLGIGSLGRGFTTVGIMQLVEKGLVDLDAPITKYLPWFKTSNKNFSDQITVRMCLNNTTAIPAQFEAVPAIEPNKSLAQFVRSLEAYYIKRKPGLSYEFSDEGYSIAGLIISELSGMTYADYLDTHIFEPLEMNRSSTNPKDFEKLKVLYGHEMALSASIPAGKSTINGNFFPAGSTVKSTANDYGNFMLMLLNDGKFKGKQFLQSSSITTIFQSNVSFQGLGTMLGGNGIDIHCGLAWLEMSIEDRPIFIQVGNTGTTAAITGLSRERNQGVVLFFNGDVNRLDRYVYPTLENTANNVIHLLNGEPTTDFAVTRFDDPYEDEDFELPKNKWSKYIGNYRAFGKESPFFKDIQIEVFEGKSGQLELKAKQEETLKGHYILQFTNESRAVLRNIAHPREIQFKIFPNGSIGGLFMSGTEFKKRTTHLTKRYKPIKVNKGPTKLSFSFPQNAKTTWDGATLLASFPGNASAKLTLTIQELAADSFDEFIGQHIGNQSITAKGNQLKKNLRDGIWTEQTIYTKENGKTQQHLFVVFQDLLKNKQASIFLTNPYGQFNSDLQEMMMYFHESVSF